MPGDEIDVPAQPRAGPTTGYDGVVAPGKFEERGLLALESGSEVGRDGSRVLLLEVTQHEFLGLDPKMA